MVNDAKIMFNISGIVSLTPEIRKERESSNVQSGDEEEDVNSYLVNPQTPYLTKFLAIAM
jgi:hypothetical protein